MIIKQMYENQLRKAKNRQKRFTTQKNLKSIPQNLPYRIEKIQSSNQ